MPFAPTLTVLASRWRCAWPRRCRCMPSASRIWLSIAGMRTNQLIGYGLVVGLDGSGDQTTQTPFTVQSIINMLANMGVNCLPGSRCN